MSNQDSLDSIKARLAQITIETRVWQLSIVATAEDCIREIEALTAERNELRKRWCELAGSDFDERSPKHSYVLSPWKAKPSRRGDLMRLIAALQIELDQAKFLSERQEIQRQIDELNRQMLEP